MGVFRDISQLKPLEVVEMFTFDTTNLGGAVVFRWHPGTTVTRQPIVWQGVTYEPFPIESSGWEAVAAGKLPRPTLRVSNIGGAIGAFLRSMQDALGAKVTRSRTLGMYLDAVNFPGGNPNANPATAFPNEIFYVARKLAENPILVEIELATAFDVRGIRLPRRQVIAGTCPWVYRSAECTYAGPPVQDIQGNATSDPAKDQCRKTLSACKARFGQYGVLPFGGFPASMLPYST